VIKPKIRQWYRSLAIHTHCLLFRAGHRRRVSHQTDVCRRHSAEGSLYMVISMILKT
jgi:hypothetical protein